MGFEETSMDTLNYESKVCHLTLQLFNHNFATPDLPYLVHFMGGGLEVKDRLGSSTMS